MFFFLFLPFFLSPNSPDTDEIFASRETSIFKDNVHLFAEGVKELEVHHVPFLEFVQ